MDYSWLLFALLSAITAALMAVAAKIGLQNVDSNTATAVRAVIMALFLIALISIQGKLGGIKEVLSNSSAMKYIVLSALLGAASWVFYFIALKAGDVSKVAPVDRLSLVFAVVFAVLLLGETVSFTAIIGIVLMAVGAIMVALG